MQVHLQNVELVLPVVGDSGYACRSTLVISLPGLGDINFQTEEWNLTP
jgi:hypothetical protein